MSDPKSDVQAEELDAEDIYGMIFQNGYDIGREDGRTITHVDGDALIEAYASRRVVEETERCAKIVCSWCAVVPGDAETIVDPADGAEHRIAQRDARDGERYRITWVKCAAARLREREETR